ncbi:MAG: hypothetical protein IPO83_01550 [Chitinophagaceae bacterium]|nr:hypothetical protein [Chitinophagaceae bacterium]
MAQDTLQVSPVDTASNLKSQKTFRLFPDEHSPKAAGIASAIIPGLGQAYNKKYWKIPIIYAGLATAGYFIYYNYTIYSNFQKTYQLRGDGDTATNLSSFDVWYITSTQTIYTDVYESTQLSELSNIYRHNTDLSIIIAAGIYALNIIDAVVDAHLFHFDVSDDLSMNVQPFYVPPVMGVARGGLTLTLTMK